MGLEVQEPRVVHVADLLVILLHDIANHVEAVLQFLSGKLVILAPNPHWIVVDSTAHVMAELKLENFS